MIVFSFPFVDRVGFMNNSSRIFNIVSDSTIII